MISTAILIATQGLIAALLAAMFLGWGSLLLGRIRSDFASMHERIFFGLSLGMALCVGLVSLVGLLGIAYPAVLLLLLVGLWGLRKVDWKAAYAQGVHWPALLFSPTLVMTLYPPTVWDDISFHLPIAQSLIHAHQITLNEFIRYPFFPLNGELLFVPGLLVNTISAQLVPWICLLTLTIGCFSEVQKHFPDHPGTKWALAFGLTGSLVLLANQLMTTLASICFIDVVVALFITSAAIAMSNYVAARDKSWLYLSAVLLGVAIGTKYTALIFCVIFGLYLLFRREWKPFVTYAGVVLAVGFPWYLRNFLYTRNPIWPFMSNVFGPGDFWNQADYQNQFGNFFGLGVEKTFLNFLNIPIYLNRVGEGPPHAFSLSLWVGLLLFLIFMRDRTKLAFYLWAIAAYTVAWFFSINLVRYYMPVVPVFAIVSAIGFLSFLTAIKSDRARIAATTGLFAYCLFSFYQLIPIHLKNHGMPPTNEQARHEYLANRLPAYRATQVAIQQPGRTYALVSENMYFYGQGKLIGDWFGPARYKDTVKLVREPAALRAHLKGLGADYLLVNSHRMRTEKLFKKRAKEIYRLGEMVDSPYFTAIYRDNHATLYRIN